VAESLGVLLPEDSLDDVLDALDETISIVVLDYDTDKKKVEKAIKKIRKVDDEVTILILSNLLTPKQLAKHQNSKVGGDIYLRTPLDEKLLLSIFESFFDIEIIVAPKPQFDSIPMPSGNLASKSEEKIEDEVKITEPLLTEIEQQVLDEHKATTIITAASIEASSKIEAAFNCAFPTEENNASNILSDIDEKERKEELEIDEIDLGLGDEELSLGGEDDSEELSLGGEDVSEELSFGAEYDSEELSLGGDDDGEELSLGGDDDGEELSLGGDDDGEELSLGGDDENLDISLGSEEDLALSPDKEPVMATQDDKELELGGMDDLELGTDEQTEGIENNDISEEPGMDLDLGGDEIELSLGGDDADTIAPLDNSSELDLGDDVELDLSAESDAPDTMDIASGELDLAEDDAGLDLGGEDAGLDLSGDDDGLEFGGEDTELDLGAEDVGLELGADDDGLEFGKEDAELDLVNEDAGLDLGAEDAGLDLSEDDDGLEFGGEDVGLDLGAEVDGLDLSEDVDGLEFGGDDAGFELGEENIDIEEIVAEDINTEDSLEFASEELASEDFASEEVADEASLEAVSSDLSNNDLPTMPDELDEIPVDTPEKMPVDMPIDMGEDEDLSFTSPGPVVDSPSGMSDDAMAKLAEIDALMGDSGDGGQQSNQDSTGEFKIDQLSASEPEDDTNIRENPLAADNENLFETPSFEEATMVMGNDDLTNPSIPAPVSQLNQQTNISESSLQQHQEISANHHDELIRLGETIKILREDRSLLLEKVQNFEEIEHDEKSTSVDLKAELDEKRIELEIIRKRYEKQMQEMKYQLDLSNDKKSVLEEQNKKIEVEYEKMNRNVKVDINKVRNHERDLEGKLEMLRSDAGMQIRNRDQKILELKRKIDTLEFDLDSIQVKERKTVHNKYALEEKMNKVINTLRGAIGDLEDDASTIKSLEEIKKNLDM